MKFTGFKMRKIQSHKGGRTSRLPSGRCTPDDLKKLKSILKRENKSYADFIHEIITRTKVE